MALIPDFPPDRPTAREVARKIHEFYQLPGNAVGGNLHIVVDDGNIKPNDILYCYERALQSNDFPAVELARLLLQLTPTQRRKALAIEMGMAQSGC